MNKRKKFDAVEMKQAIQEKLYEETQGMSETQKQEYRRKSIESGPLAAHWKAIREQQAKRKRAG